MSTFIPEVSFHVDLRRLYDELSLAHSFAESLGEAVENGYSHDSYSPDDMAQTLSHFIRQVDCLFVRYPTHIDMVERQRETQREYKAILARAKGKLSEQELTVLYSEEYRQRTSIFQTVSDSVQQDNAELSKRNRYLEQNNMFLTRRLQEAEEKAKKVALISNKGGLAYA